MPSIVLVVSSLLLGGRLASADNVELDSPSTPAGYGAFLLISEAAFPGERGDSWTKPAWGTCVSTAFLYGGRIDRTLEEMNQ